MALIAGLGRWRRYTVPDGSTGLTPAEMATVLRAIMPLTLLPGHAGRGIGLAVTVPTGSNGHRETSTLQGLVDADGVMRFNETTDEPVEASASGTVTTWLAALLNGNRGRIQVRGDLALVDDFLTQLYEVLWGREGAVALERS
jgi:hypothetical protein